MWAGPISVGISLLTSRNGVHLAGLDFIKAPPEERASLEVEDHVARMESELFGPQPCELRRGPCVPGGPHSGCMRL